MAISFVGSMAPVGANNGGNVTLTFTGASGLLDSSGAQASLQQGDVVVCAYASSGTADLAMSTSSAGWTEVHEAYANGTIDTNLGLYYKVMGASPDTSFVAVGPTGTSNATIATAFAFRGVDSSVLDVAFVAGSHAATGTGTSVPNPPAITPSTAGAWPLVVGAGVAGAGAAYTAPAGLSTSTNHFRSLNHAETNDCAIGLGFKTDWASGAFDCPAFGGGNVNASNSWAALVIALKPETLQTLTPNLFTNSQTFHGPTVTPGAVTLSPSALQNDAAFHAPTVSHGLAASLLTNSQTFFEPTVSQGAQALEPALFTNSQSFHGPTVSASYSLTPDLFTNGQSFHAPALSFTLLPALMSNGQVFYAPAVAGGPQSLEAGLFTNSSEFFLHSMRCDRAFLRNRWRRKRYGYGFRGRVGP